jgi:thymidylate synthase (FAD)
MKVTLIASTALENDPPYMPGLSVIEQWMPDPMDSVDDVDRLEEFAGRSCYQSFHKPNPTTKFNSDYLKHILELGHESVLEHSTATFYVQGVSRTLTHELVRHRHLSFSQKSQRYVNESMASYTPPGDLMDRSGDPHIALLLRKMSDHHVEALNLYGEIVEALGDPDYEHRVDIKRARGAARSVLMGSIHTSIVVSGNMRAWRDFLRKRYHVAAEREIRELAQIILGELRLIATNTFQDIPTRPFGSVDGDSTASTNG